MSSVTQNGQEQYELSLHSPLLCFHLNLQKPHLGDTGKLGMYSSLFHSLCEVASISCDTVLW